MKKEICLIAAIPSTLPSGASGNDGITREFVECQGGYWHSAAINHCMAVVSALVGDQSNFLVKVLTTSPSDSAFVRKLKSLEPDIVLTGFPVEKSTEIAKAIDGSFGVFLVTDTIYDRESSVEEEVLIGRAVADACLLRGIRHVVHSTQMHVYACIGLRSDPCDAKAHVADYFQRIGIPKTLLVVPPLYEDFSYGVLKPVKTERKDLYKIIVSTGYIPIDMISIKDLGLCVRSIFKNSDGWIGKTVTLSGDKLTLKEYAQTMTQLMYPYTIEDAQVTPEEFIERNQWDGAEDMANYFDYLTRGVQRNNQMTTMLLEDKVVSFHNWVEAKKENLTKAFLK